jgi:hypothetical protein
LFSAVFYFRKVTHEIFSELDETKARRPDIYRSFQRIEEEMEKEPHGGHTTRGRGLPLARTDLWCGPPSPLLMLPLRL